jgi:hypothetical protein
MDEKTAPKMKGMHFMIQKRTDFGPDGWDEVMPGAEFDIVKANGANHFSLMVSLLLSYTRSCMSELYANKSCSKSRTSTW